METEFIFNAEEEVIEIDTGYAYMKVSYEEAKRILPGLNSFLETVETKKKDKERTKISNTDARKQADYYGGL